MGIYINMELPNNCINCAARHGAECWLADCSYIPNYHKERPKWCPLVQVLPNGRLIDAGELYDKVDAILTQILGYRDGEDVRSQSFQSGAYYSIQKVKNALSNAPTIIPAEEA